MDFMGAHLLADKFARRIVAGPYIDDADDATPSKEPRRDPLSPNSFDDDPGALAPPKPMPTKPTPRGIERPDVPMLMEPQSLQIQPQANIFRGALYMIISFIICLWGGAEMEGVNIVKDFVVPISVIVAAAAIIGALAAFRVHGESFWKQLGTFDPSAADPANRVKGVRPTFALAALASALASGTLVDVFVRKPTPPPPPSLTIKTFPPEQPDYLVNNNNDYMYRPKDIGHQISDEKFDVCGLSYVSGNGNGQCGVSASKDGFWTIHISGERYCKVTCLKYGAR